MTTDWRNERPCTSCGRDSVLGVARGSACAECLHNLCLSAVESWHLWFSEDRPKYLGSRKMAAEDAETHADLALAYAEMTLVPDAIAESVIAIASEPSFAARSGGYILDHLSRFGWQRFASGSCRRH